MGISGFLALNENPELRWTALIAELPPMLLPRFDIRNSLARKSTDMQRLLCARPSAESASVKNTWFYSSGLEH